MTLTLKPEPLGKAEFAPFGDVIETSNEPDTAMNESRFERFGNLCIADTAGNGRVAVSIVRCRVATELPWSIGMVERHPLGSQAFVPLSRSRMIIVVGPGGARVDPEDLRAFVTNGRQGINYHRGTWHMPLIAFETGQEFLVIDRAGAETNCDFHTFDEPVMLVGG